ncbi:uncharacterized protein LOC103703207 [Phoenix dactylifera]|uniref:Uncharacterized protein LOC103703207 n=1 Tax=Phoenix dactylifera TaxID=42345 RepID=A0A8B9AKY3_PHODC|nr:uncharacterized protein LOC103703207 [Phoenix dactylifera]
MNKYLGSSPHLPPSQGQVPNLRKNLCISYSYLLWINCCNLEGKHGLWSGCSRDTKKEGLEPTEYNSNSVLRRGISSTHKDTQLLLFARIVALLILCGVQARKQELRRIPEQAILSEVRCMVEQMQALNRQLEETEAAIEEYFKPIDKNAEIIMDMQLEKEEKQMKEMLKAMNEQAMLQREMAAKKIVSSADVSHPTQQMASTPSNQEQAK